MWKTTPITLLFLLALMPWLDPPGVLSFKWDFNSSAAIFSSAALGFLLQWSGALALGYDSLLKSSGLCSEVPQVTIKWNILAEAPSLCNP